MQFNSYYNFISFMIVRLLILFIIYDRKSIRFNELNNYLIEVLYSIDSNHTSEI